MLQPLPVNCVISFSSKKLTVASALMASVIINKGTSLLIFISVLQGTLSQTVGSLLHKTEVNAAVGQNISLPCIMFKTSSNIIQLQWHKKDEHREQKLVMFNPSYPLIYYVNVTLEPVRETNTTKLLGSILHLQEVTEKDIGIYICEITSFPDGSIKYPTKVQVTVPNVSVKVTPTDRTVIEGDAVNFTCVSDPPPDKYILSFSLSQSTMESQDGRFRIQKVSRHMSDLICQPLWNSSNQRLQSLNATVHLTVDFLDNIECNSESQIQVESKTNLTITCEAKSSKSLHFAWMKDNMTVSSSASLNLWSARPDQSGTYTLIVHTGNDHLHRQKYFTVTVTNRTHTEHLSSTMIMESTTQVTTTQEPDVTTQTSRPQHASNSSDATSTEVMYISISAPSTGNVTLVHVNDTTPHTGMKSPDITFPQTSREDRTLCCTSSPGSTSREINYVPSDTSTFIFTSGSISRATVRISNDLTTKITKQDGSTSKSHAVFVIIPFLLVLALIGFLYRKYLIQKRLDMPPPFKPPPPPVKYTSARNHDIPVTDILVY